MTTLLSHDDWDTTGFTVTSYAEEHLTMHQFMYEITAADPTSCGFLAPDCDGGQQDEQWIDYDRAEIVRQAGRYNQLASAEGISCAPG